MVGHWLPRGVGLGRDFFLRTADSGFKAQGHYLTTTPAGATLWSGGMDGPEGSVLVVPVVLLLLTHWHSSMGAGGPPL